MAELAAAGDSHIIDIAVDDTAERADQPPDQLAASPNHCHVIIDVNVDATAAPPEPHECAVCMERLRWVAVGPCGHLEVCSKCTVRIRSGDDGNRQCCICRTPCPTVVVTRRSRAGDGKDVYTKVSSLAADEGLVGNYWYHKASAAYFDDERRYNAARRACSELQGAEVGDEDENDEIEASSVVVFVVYVVINVVGGMMMCMGYATGDQHWSHKLAMLLRNGFLFAAVASTLWFLLDWLHRERARERGRH